MAPFCVSVLKPLCLSVHPLPPPISFGLAARLAPHWVKRSRTCAIEGTRRAVPNCYATAGGLVTNLLQSVCSTEFGLFGAAAAIRNAGALDPCPRLSLQIPNFFCSFWALAQFASMSSGSGTVFSLREIKIISLVATRAAGA
jgi:hypothetical protein